MAARKRSARSQTRSSTGRSRTGSARGPRAGDAARFDALLERPEALPAALYLSGADEAAKTEALARLKDAWSAAQPEIRPTVLRAGEAGPEQVLTEAQGASLFAPVSFVIVLRVEDWTRSARTVEAAAEGAARVPAGNRLVFVESASESERKTLAPLRAACGAYVSLDGLEPDRLARWGLAHLERLGVTTELEALEVVLEGTRLDTAEVFNELEKLAAWAGPGGRVSRADAERLLRPVLGGRLATLARAVAERRGEDAVDQLLRALETGEREATVLFQLQTLYGGALRLQSGQWGWVRDRENSGRLARGRTERELAEGLDLLYRTERAWKGGRAEVRTLLIRAVVGLAEGETAGAGSA